MASQAELEQVLTRLECLGYGKKMRELFMQDQGYVQLNHGSVRYYGSPSSNIFFPYGLSPDCGPHDDTRLLPAAQRLGCMHCLLSLSRAL